MVKLVWLVACFELSRVMLTPWSDVLYVHILNSFSLIFIVHCNFLQFCFAFFLVQVSSCHSKDWQVLSCSIGLYGHQALESDYCLPLFLYYWRAHFVVYLIMTIVTIIAWVTSPFTSVVQNSSVCRGAGNLRICSLQPISHKQVNVVVVVPSALFWQN